MKFATKWRIKPGENNKFFSTTQIAKNRFSTSIFQTTSCLFNNYSHFFRHQNYHSNSVNNLSTNSPKLLNTPTRKYLSTTINSIQPDDKTFEILIDKCSTTGNLQKAVEYYEKIFNTTKKDNKKASPTLNTFQILFRLLKKNPNDNLTTKFVNEMKFHFVHPSLSIYNDIIAQYLQADDFYKANDYFNEMITKEPKIKPNSQTFDHFLRFCEESSNLPLANYFFEKTVDLKVTLDLDIFRLLIKICYLQEDCENANYFYDLMIKSNIIPDHFIYKMLINLCNFINDKDKAEFYECQIIKSNLISK